jgi:D-arabinose 1-dehydrogenase-like Zn-dependent alcohol dehydrogenase
MGTEDEFLSMLDFFYKHQLKPIIDSSYPLENIADAFKRMDQGDQFGKIILSIS